MSSTVPPPPGPLHPLGRPEVEGEVEAEAGDVAGCHLEGVAGATTMEARPGAAAAVVVVAVGVAAARPLDDEGA